MNQELLVRFESKDKGQSFKYGEMKENKRHGRVIFIDSGGYIHIGYWNNDDHRALGNSINIWSGGEVILGRRYLQGGLECHGLTSYNKDGTIRYSD